MTVAWGAGHEQSRVKCQHQTTYRKILDGQTPTQTPAKKEGTVSDRDTRSHAPAIAHDAAAMWY